MNIPYNDNILGGICEFLLDAGFSCELKVIKFKDSYRFCFVKIFSVSRKMFVEFGNYYEHFGVFLNNNYLCIGYNLDSILYLSKLRSGPIAVLEYELNNPECLPKLVEFLSLNENCPK